jgi:ferredoxin--NADP+ reductase
VPHVVTQPCCSDGSCVYACPVNCIQPTPDDPDFARAEMLYIDPATCVDCGACVSACPVEAIKPQAALSPDELPFVAINRDYYGAKRPRPPLAPVPAPLAVREGGAPLRVAIVGSGPAAMYAADELLTIPGARVDMFERLPVPYGLARAGVAPDHPRTRQVMRRFDRIRARRRLRLFLGVEVGVDVHREDLLRDHHAVLYAVGAASDRRLELPGIDLPGAASATSFVGWYNGHPDFAERDFDLSHPRAVVIGNGNVALDVARMLTIDPCALDDTDIAPRALRALRASRVQQVVVAGRRGPADSAFTLPELIGLSSTPGVEIVVAPEDLAEPKLEPLRARRPSGAGARRIVLRYRLRPARVLGSERVHAVEFDSGEAIEAGLVLTSIGYRGRPVPGLPFDPDTGTVPNQRGRVIGLPRTFVAGWIKRGPTGFIGTNKACACETVRTLVEDFNRGLLQPGRLAA